MERNGRQENPWDERAQAYRESAPHASGPDLDLLVEWAGPGEARAALDVGTGGGHLARRLREAGFTVTTADPSAGMWPDVICRAEELPFPAASFDLVGSRIAAHHYADDEAGLAEMARVTRDVVLLEDLLFVDERIEEAEKLRDPSHVRTRTLEEWRDLFAAHGLRVETTEVIERHTSYSAWLERCGCSGETAERTRELLAHRLDGDDYLSTVFLIKGRKER
ncbi:MAG: class I SAM-dependent methyltransferase [Gaiellaceae bacterium]|jgi:SAM-dependent methyltransferase